MPARPGGPAGGRDAGRSAGLLEDARGSHDSLTCLSGFAADDFALVPHALALVRVRPAQPADVRGHLADLLLVDALDGEPGRGLDAERDAVRCRDHDRVREPERELQVTA